MRDIKENSAPKFLRMLLSKRRLQHGAAIMGIAVSVAVLVTGLSVLAKISFGSALFGNNVVPSGAAAGQPDYPESFQIRHVIFALGHKFTIETPENPNVGLIQEDVLSLGRTFRLYDNRGALVAKARQKLFSLGVQIDIVDANDKPIASLQEEVLSSLLKVVTSYRILGPDGRQIGESEKLALGATDIDINDSRGIPVITLHRLFWNWPADKWFVNVHSNQIDERIAPLIAAFKSARDADRSSSSSSSSSSSKVK